MILISVIEIAQWAWDIILQKKKDWYKKTYKTETWNYWKDIVTEADTLANDYILQGLGEWFPWDIIISEENSINVIDYSKPTRIIDPLDGTWIFSAWKDYYCVLIWRVLNGKVDLWVAHFPWLQKTYYAQKWVWAFLNWKRISLWEKTNCIIETHKNNTKGYIKNDTYSYIDSHSCVWFSLCSIAAWEISWFIRTSNSYHKRDTCAPHIIVEEAWWYISDIYWNTLDYSQDKNNWENWVVVAWSKSDLDDILEWIE